MIIPDTVIRMYRAKTGLAGDTAMNIICAYPVNIDAVYNVRGEEISPFTQSGPTTKISGELKESIGSRNDLISSLLFCMQQGSGAELLIESQALAEQIEAFFPWQFRLGGNAGIMANVLASMGARPVLNAPALGPRLAGMLHPDVSIPVSGILKEPRLAAGEPELDKEAMHFVFQFKKGDAVSAPDNRIIAAGDNRFIATYDPVNTSLKTNADFDAFCLANAGEFDGALLSGFHLAPFELYQEIFPARIAQIKSWKEKNPKIFIHAEMGSFQNPEIMQYLLPRLPVDSLGLNEDELAVAEGSFSSWSDCMQAVKRLRKRLGLFRVAVHTRDYILSAILEEKITATDEHSALQSGTDAAAALAATGSAKGEPPLEVNSTGLEAREEFCHNGATKAGRGAFFNSGDEIISLMPSLLAKKPLITVGLGDTATVAIFFQELKAINGKRNLIS
jgi:ADP-dependent phosphofructokinase/glucokinase